MFKSSPEASQENLPLLLPQAMALPLPNASEHRKGGGCLEKQGQEQGLVRASTPTGGPSRVAQAAGTGEQVPDPTPRAVLVYSLLGSCLRDELDWGIVGGGS